MIDAAKEFAGVSWSEETLERWAEYLLVRLEYLRRRGMIVDFDHAWRSFGEDRVVLQQADESIADALSRVVKTYSYSTIASKQYRIKATFMITMRNGRKCSVCVELKWQWIYFW